MLLCLGVGSIVAMPLAGALAARFGCRVVLLIGGAAICLVFPLLALAPTAPLMAVALFLFGASLGSVDCVINMQAIVVERADRPAADVRLPRALQPRRHRRRGRGQRPDRASARSPLAATLAVAAVMAAGDRRPPARACWRTRADRARSRLRRCRTARCC